MAEHVDISYLKNPVIGPILAKGLAVTFRTKPQFPIDFFAKWLLNYSKSQEQEKEVYKHLEKKAELIEKFEEKKKIAEQRKKEEQERLEAKRKIDEDYRETIRQHHEELLYYNLPNFIEQRQELTGCYIGVLDYPNKEIAEDDDEEIAHLDNTQPKLIKYIGASTSHGFLEGKTLSLESGVTGFVFKEPEAKGEPAEGEPAVEDPKKYVYIPNVVNDQRMFFFKIPKLGAYMALPLKYNSCLSENSFQLAVEERIRYLSDKETKAKEREEKELEYNEKFKELEDIGEDTGELEKNWEAEKQTWEDAVENDFPTTLKEYVVCVDTLGQDREISEEARNFIEELVNLFATSWENNEKTILNADIDSMKNFNKEAIENLVSEEEKNIEERAADLEKFQDNEVELNYEKEAIKLEKVVEQLKYSFIHDGIVEMSKYRVIRFPGILQGILYFLKYPKEDVNIPNTNILNWKLVKNIICQNEFFDKIYEYDHRGAKPDPVPPYAMLNRLLRRFEKYNPEEVEAYNVPYSRLFRWITLVIQCRKSNISIRRDQFAKREQDKAEKIEQNNLIKQQESEKMNEHKETLNPDDLEAFDEEEWIRNYYEENPLNEIPEDEVRDVDLDWEEE